MRVMAIRVMAVQVALLRYMMTRAAMLPDSRPRLLAYQTRVGCLPRFGALFFVIAVLLATTSGAHAATATWNANPETDIAGYIVSYGTQPGVHPTSVDVGSHDISGHHPHSGTDLLLRGAGVQHIGIDQRRFGGGPLH